MNLPWSHQLERRYKLTLAPDLVAWLDDEVWNQGSGAEFRHARSPAEMLEPDEGVIWAGFMPPDTLPIIGNDYGDWLCLRIARDGRVSEVIYWCHGGGDWVPYGNSLAEALIYDAAFAVLYPRRPELDEPTSRKKMFQSAAWAFDWIKPGSVGSASHAGTPAPGNRLKPFWIDQQPPSRSELLSELANSGISEIAARRDLILRDLESPLKTQSSPRTAQAIGAPWEPDFVSWIFDTALIPELRKEDLKNHFNVPVRELTQQDWDAAEREALKVIALRQDLGWAFDIAGWAAERRGDIERAISHYARGVQASAFADDSIRFRTHWFTEGYGKFAAARLLELRDRLPAKLQDDAYLLEFWGNDPESLRARIRDYWLSQAEAAEREKRYAAAYQYYYNAGWDCGLQFVKSYQPILEALSRSASLAGFPALAEVANLHRQFL